MRVSERGCVPKTNEVSCNDFKKGTILKINIPAGAEINLLNLIEVTSPSGICLIIRIPFLGKRSNYFNSVLEAVREAGGTVEFMN
ncbi:MAG: hypothetical protein ACOCRK_07790 [bacterium]